MIEGINTERISPFFLDTVPWIVHQKVENLCFLSAILFCVFEVPQTKSLALDLKKNQPTRFLVK